MTRLLGLGLCIGGLAGATVPAPAQERPTIVPSSAAVGADGVVKTIHVGMFTPQALEAEVTPYLQE